MICILCKESLSEEMFYVDKSKSSGRKPRCKICERLYRDPVKRRIYEKEYWSTRKEHKQSIVKKSNSKNKEHHKKVRRKYLNSERGNSIHRKHSQTRRARMLLAFVEEVNPMDVYNNDKGICYICHKFFEFKDTELEHLIPLSKGGEHSRANVKTACVTCNREKGAKVSGGVY